MSRKCRNEIHDLRLSRVFMLFLLFRSGFCFRTIPNNSESIRNIKIVKPFLHPTLKSLPKSLLSSVSDNMEGQTNVLGGSLVSCSTDPMTGYYRTGFCACGPGDYGVHSVCASLTAEFLDYTKSRGNDLSTPRPQFGFPGLKPGDQWCLCASRWKEAMEAGCAPKVVLEATNSLTTEIVPLDVLQQYALVSENQEAQENTASSHEEL